MLIFGPFQADSPNWPFSLRPCWRQWLRSVADNQTDLHVIKDEWPLKPNRPSIAGHEGAGIIVAINDPISKLKVGDRVGIKWIAHSCNQCDYCISGDEPLCAEAKCSGINADGSFMQ
ncbi:MAG: alcohol dehydrogenase catalytic domain-containing protein [Cutibacterium acnes]|nr:alcohol dehydrogenase catalytic domain-containing protein [Cutibacterium acnes]